jgi:hypothetical protein
MNFLDVALDDTFDRLIDNDDDDDDDDDSIVINTVSLLSSIDVLGVDSNTNGRSCCQHECCGHMVEKNDVLYCSWQLQTIDRSCDFVPFTSPVELSASIESNAATLSEGKRKPAPRKRNEVKRKSKKTTFRNSASQSFNLFDVSDDDDGYEEVVKVFKIEKDGMANCHVGYLPRRLFKKHGANKFDSLFLRVVDDLRTSPNSADRARSHRNHGMVTCAIIHNNNRYTGKKPLDGVPCIRSSSESDGDDISDEESKQSDSLGPKLEKQQRIKHARKNYNRYSGKKPLDGVPCIRSSPESDGDDISDEETKQSDSSGPKLEKQQRIKHARKNYGSHLDNESQNTKESNIVHSKEERIKFARRNNL